jgi:2'-5' RNA ligase
MIRTFIAIELNNRQTIENIIEFTKRLKQNQSKIKVVKPENLHLTVKFLGNIPETQAPKIFKLIKEEVNNPMFNGKTMKYSLKGVGQFHGFSVIWITMLGDIDFLQSIKNKLEIKLYQDLEIAKDKRSQFKPHLTIARMRKNRINYKTFDIFKKLIYENKDTEFGTFDITGIKLKKSTLTPQGPIYTDLVF